MATFAPHVARAVTEINRVFPALGKGGTYLGHGGASDGGSRYSADFWSTSKAYHDAVFPWLRANARRLGIKYIISWERIWSVARASEGIRRYSRYGPGATASQAHRNHIHITFNINPPVPIDPPAITTGVPLMATATAVRVSYKGAQPLDAGSHIYINAAEDVTIVRDGSEGIDLTATVDIDGLKEGEFVDIWWSREWKKSGATPRVVGGDIPITVRGNDAVQIRYADKLSKADTGWIACLRLRYATNSKTAVMAALQVRGWKL
jgi:hypothetical protein